jgi:hypothetical protein
MELLGEEGRKCKTWQPMCHVAPSQLISLLTGVFGEAWGLCRISSNYYNVEHINVWKGESEGPEGTIQFLSA